jgi:hypothetical protein
MIKFPGLDERQADQRLAARTMFLVRCQKRAGFLDGVFDLGTLGC